MKIQILTENTAINNNFTAEHGLSIYIETLNHKILFDSGQTDAFIKNAEKMSVDLENIDIAVLSHGHYDHGGGLADFMKINKKSKIYVNRNVFKPYFNAEKKYIGIDVDLRDNERIICVDNEKTIDEELSLYSCNNEKRVVPVESFGLGMMENNVVVPDDFKHEQYLLIEENGKKVLISGCSHKGILNIVQWFKPDILIGGFHFMKLDCENKEHEAFLSNAAKILMSYKTVYYTGHCTGIGQYEYLKAIMGDRLEYMSTGQTIIC